MAKKITSVESAAAGTPQGEKMLSDMSDTTSEGENVLSDTSETATESEKVLSDKSGTAPEGRKTLSDKSETVPESKKTSSEKSETAPEGKTVPSEKSGIIPEHIDRILKVNSAYPQLYIDPHGGTFTVNTPPAFRSTATLYTNPYHKRS